MSMKLEGMAEIAALLAANCSDELAAQRGYIELAERMEALGCPTEHIAEIREIAGDERNHTLTELKLLAYYDPKTKIASDGMDEAIEVIQAQLGTD